MGEAVTGDIQSFLKTQNEEETERQAVDRLFQMLPEDIYRKWSILFDEMEELRTPEARVYKALDNMEAVLQHNECDISAWLPLEYELQKTYGTDKVKGFPVLEVLRSRLLADTEAKIKAAQSE